MARQIVIACLLFHLSIGWTFANQDTQVQVDSLIEVAKNDSTSFAQMIRIAKEALSLAEIVDYKKGLHDAYSTIGIGHLNLAQYKEALEYFQRSYRIAQQMEDKECLAFSQFFIGNVHNYLGDLQKATQAYEASLALYKEINNPRWVGLVINSIGVVLSKNEKYPESLATFEESLDILEENDLEEDSAIPINNIGDHYLRQKLPEKALPYFERSLQIDRDFKAPRGEAISLCNIGLCLIQLKQYNEALNYLDQSTAIAQQWGFQEIIYDNYKFKSDLLKEIGQFEEALVYHEKYSSLKDTVLGQEKNELIADLQVRYDMDTKDQELQASKDRIDVLEQQKIINRLTNYFAIGFVALLILIGYLGASRYQYKQRSIEMELKNKGLESQQLKKELAFKQKDLTNFALDIARKNNFSSKVHQSLEEIHKSNDPKFRKKMVRDLLHLTSNHLKINEDIKEFQMNVEKVNLDFFDRLNKQFPELTNNERHLCGLIRLNLSTKDIASVRNISPKSVEMGRYRLRKKLNLDPKEDLTAFLQSF